MEQRGNGKEDGKDEQAAVDFRRVDTDEDGGASDNEKSVMAEAVGLCIGKENERGQKKKEK